MSVETDLHTGFAVALLHALPSVAGDNVVVSPWSVSSALAVLAPGCDESARREIELALGPSADAGGLLAGLAADAATVAGNRDSNEGSVLMVANTLWVDDGRTPVPAFVRHLDRWPGAVLRSAPMASDPERARASINADVALTTRDLIQEVLPDGSITTEERAVIVNALYLVAGWVEPFADAGTTEQPFHGLSGTRQVPVMRGSRDAGYAHDGWEYLALPLQLGLQSEILLPPVGVDPHLRVIDPTVLIDLRNRATGHRVDLHMPRFRAEWRTGLLEPLCTLNVCRIFDPGALALVRVVAEQRLHVSATFHATVLRVDESGIEGAATAALVARAVAFRHLTEVEVRVDRPFFFLVTHRETGVVVFLAYITEP